MKWKRSSSRLPSQQQHQELLVRTSSTSSRQNRSILFFVSETAMSAAKEIAPIPFIDFEEIVAAIGHDGDGFAYDNEGPRQSGTRSAFSAGNAAGHKWRIHRVHRGQRL